MRRELAELGTAAEGRVGMKVEAKVTRDPDGRGARVETAVKRDRDGLTRCRVCGCTGREACNPPCGWADGSLCTNCFRAVSALREWKERAHRDNMTALLRELEAQWNDAFLACSRAARGARR